MYVEEVAMDASANAGAESLSCQLCGYLSPTLRIYISHLRQVHSKDDKFSVICGIQQCRLRFSTFGAYNSHVYRMHRSSLGLNIARSNDERQISEPEVTESLSLEEVYQVPTYRFENSDPPEELQYDVWHLLGMDQDQQQKEAATFLLKLKEVCNVSERTVSEVITGYQGLLTNTLAVVKASVKDTLGNAGVCVADIAGLDEAFTNVQDVFQGLDTTYRQEKYFRDQFKMVVRSMP
jgi:hypothetical protein